MKKTLVVLVICFAIFFQNISFSNSAYCNYNPETNQKIGDALENCVSDTGLAGKNTGNLQVSGKGFKEKINSWRNTLAVYLGIAAVFGLVYAGFMFTISAGEEEKVTKAKNIAKWSVLGFLAIIFAATIITFVVGLFYSI